MRSGREAPGPYSELSVPGHRAPRKSLSSHPGGENWEGFLEEETSKLRSEINGCQKTADGGCLGPEVCREEKEGRRGVGP